MKVKAKKVLTINDELCKKLDDRQAETISGGGFKFPCDGPGRGGTCQISS